MRRLRAPPFGYPMRPGVQPWYAIRHRPSGPVKNSWPPGPATSASEPNQARRVVTFRYGPSTDAPTA